MLRISKASENPFSVELKLEGRIVSEWVSVLEAEILDWGQKKQQVLLDFCAVTFVDERGLRMLKRRLSGDIRITNCAGFIETLLKGGSK